MKSLRTININNDVIFSFFNVSHNITKQITYVDCLLCNKKIKNVNYAISKHANSKHSGKKIISDPYDKYEVKIFVKLKNKFKRNKNILLKETHNKIKMPKSSSCLEYFRYYLSDYNYRQVFNERKKLFVKTTLLRWYIKEYKQNISIDDRKYIGLNLKSIRENISNSAKISQNKEETKLKNIQSRKNYYNSEKYKKYKCTNKYKQKLENRRVKMVKTIRKRWEDEEWKKEIIQKRKDSGFYDRLSITFKNKFKYDTEFKKEFTKRMNSKSRIKKISNSSKKFWRELKKNNPDRFKQLAICFKSSFQNKIIRDNGFKMNNVEYFFSTLLDNYKINYVYEYNIKINNHSYYPDFYLPEYNIIIEIFGDYWHANKKFFKAKDRIFKNIFANDIWKKDAIRENDFLSNGYKFIVIWQSELKQNNINKIKERLECLFVKK